MEKLAPSSVLEEEDECYRNSCVAETRGQIPEDLDTHVWHVLERTALAHPRREAVVSAWQPQQLADGSQAIDLHHDSCLRWTYQDLFDKSLLLASALQEAGCRSGMRLSALLWNSAEWALLFWATTRMGMTFAPIDPRDPTEARRMMRLIEADVVVVQDEQSAEIVDEEKMAARPGMIRIQCSGVLSEGWLNLHRLCTDTTRNSPDGASGDQKYDVDAVILIIFTSGTSGLSKGCVHKSRNLISQTNNYDPNEDLTVVDRWLVHTPVSHIFAINNMLRAWRLGDAVVFPSKTFDVDLTIRAIVDEECTIMSATPTLVKALVAHPSFPGAGAVKLNLVTIAATMVRVDDIRLCQSRLGSKDSIQAYGMSEGAPLISWCRTDETIRGGFHPGVGRALPGAAIRICHPYTHKIVARNEVGELHVSGPSVIGGYLDDADAESFYDDSYGRWLMTGDQGMMDSEGIVHIFGRYKDIIIRGGENINPRIIEEVLADIPGVREAHVVGVPDSMAGELPVAVVKLDPTASKTHVQNKAFALGPKYALNAVHTYEELGIENVPTTSLNKVKKQELKRMVLDQCRKREANSFISPFTAVNGSLTQSLMAIWEDLTGHRPTTAESLTHTADSILLLRYCDAVSRSCGQRMYLQDVVEHDTVEKQAGMLRGKMTSHETCEGADACVSDQRSAGTISGNAWQANPVIGQSIPKSKISNHSDLNGHFSVMPEKEMSESAAEKRLRVLGLSRSIVEDTIPLRNSLHRTVFGQRPQSYHVRMVFRVHHASVQQIIRGTEKALAGHAMLRTVVSRTSDGVPQHLVVKTDHQLLEALVSTRHVESETDAQAQWEDDSIGNHLSNFMFRCEIISVRVTGNKYLSLQYNHSVVDALSLWPWHQDLDRLIDDVNAEITLQTPYRRFSELFSLYEDSSLAKRAVSFHVKRLRGISRLTQALWPVQRAPGWMISNDEGSCFATERHRIREQVWDGQWQEKSALFQYPRLGRVVHVPQIQKMKEHGVEVSLFAKCAVFLFNTLQTGSSYAILNTWESGRSWPFVPTWIESSLPPAMSVSGPTAQWILHVAQVLDDESVMDYFQRMAGEFRDVEQHQHAPWQRIVEELRDEGALAEDASFRQAFVWDVSLGLASSGGFRDDMKTLEAVARMDWADCGLFWNAFTIDAENLYFIASWDTAQMNDVEVGECCDLLAEVMRRLANEENWHRSVSSVASALKSGKKQTHPTHFP